VLSLSTLAYADEERAFYKHYDYGSQSVQTPISALLNRSFDNLQLRNGRRGMQVSAADTQNVLENLASPFDAIERTGEGWKTFLTTEALPLSFGKNSARWIPNYGLHLLGGGQTFAWVREWFLDHDAPEPLATAFAAATLLTGALVNESIENKGVRGANTDAIADIYLFDLGGILLFSVPAVRRFFSKTLILSDWSLQPAITFPDGHLHNVGNYYSLKVPLYDRFRLFVYGGVSTLGGLSVRLGDGYSISAAGGVRGDRFENIGGATILSNIVRFKPSGALFLDRNESLLAVVQVSDVPDYFISANMYPNAFFRTDPGLGAWTAIGKDGGWTVGVSFTRALGLGFGLGTR
jgi:hypothetical protein